MLTKEECEKALEHIKTLRGSNYGGYYSGFNNSALPFDEDTNVISKLIKEHFEDKETLKERFKGYDGETSKEDPWGDRYADECSKEEINKWILEGYGMPPIREEEDVD